MTGSASPGDQRSDPLPPLAGIRVTAGGSRPVDSPAGVVDAYAPRLVEGLHAVYVDWARRYEAKLRGSPWPVVPLVSEDGSTDSVVIDTDLLSTLIGGYLTDGWSWVGKVLTYARAQAASARAQAASDPDHPSGGVLDAGMLDTRNWPDACQFVVLARNILAVMIRDELRRIEALAVTRIQARVTLSATQVENAYTNTYQVQEDGREGQKVITVGNKALLATLTVAINQVIEVRKKRDAVLHELVRMEGMLAAVRRHEAERETSNVLSTPDRTTSGDLAAQVVEKMTLAKSVTDLYTCAVAWLGTNDPFALLILDRFTNTPPPEDLERCFGLALSDLRATLGSLAGAIKPDRSHVAELLPGLPSAPGSGEVLLPVDPTLLASLAIPDEGPELHVINFVQSRLQSDQGLIPLVHQETWRRLITDGDIPRDSFTYVVLHQYLQALNLRLAAADRASTEWQSFFDTFARVSAGLSVALMVTPLAELAPVFRGASTLATAVIMAYRVDSVVSQLRAFDQTLNTDLAAAEGAGTAALAAVGALAYQRREYLNGLTETIMWELLLVAAGGAWPKLKPWLHRRGFLLDMKTVFAADTAAADTSSGAGSSKGL